MFKKGELVWVNPDHCLARYSQFAVRHIRYVLRWSYNNFPKTDHMYRIIGIHKTSKGPIIVVQDTLCKIKKCNPIFFMEVQGVSKEEEK